MVESGDVAEFVDGLGEDAVEEAFGVGGRAVERGVEAGDADHGAAPRDGRLAEDEIEPGDEEVDVGDAQAPAMTPVSDDQGVEDRLGVILRPCVIEPGGVEGDGRADPDGCVEACRDAWSDRVEQGGINVADGDQADEGRALPVSTPAGGGLGVERHVDALEVRIPRRRGGVRSP